MSFSAATTTMTTMTPRPITRLQPCWYMRASMRFPSSLKKVGEWAIYRSDIKEAVFEGGETEVCKYAFYWCRYLFSVTCPSSVKVSPSAFELCKSLVHSPAVTEAETEEE